MIAAEEDRLLHTTIGATEKIQEFLKELGSSGLSSGSSLGEILKRPEITYDMLAPIDTERRPLPEDVIFEAEINIKYDGYIKRQMRQVEQFKKMAKIRPENMGQASRISGVSPADISVLLVYLEHFKAANLEEEGGKGIRIK